MTGQQASEIFKFESVKFSSFKGKWVVWSGQKSNSSELVISTFDDDSIKNERASMETAFSHYKSMGNCFRRSRAANSSFQSGRNSNSSEILCMALLPASIKRIESKIIEKTWRHRFPHYKSMWAFCCHENQSFDPICHQNLIQPFPHPSAATHKILFSLAHWLQRYSSLKVLTTMTDDDGRTRDHWYTISSPCEPSAQVS